MILQSSLDFIPSRPEWFTHPLTRVGFSTVHSTMDSFRDSMCYQGPLHSKSSVRVLQRGHPTCHRHPSHILHRRDLSVSSSFFSLPLDQLRNRLTFVCLEDQSMSTNYFSPQHTHACGSSPVVHPISCSCFKHSSQRTLELSAWYHTMYHLHYLMSTSSIPTSQQDLTTLLCTCYVGKLCYREIESMIWNPVVGHAYEPCMPMLCPSGYSYR